MSVSYPESSVLTAQEELASLRRLWWLFLVLGLVSVIVGFLAISSKYIVVTTWAAVVFLGVLLLVAGITEIVHAVMVRNLKGFALHLIAAALYLLAGVVMLENPIWTAEVLTLLLAAAFFVGGVFRIVFSVVMRFHAWPWVLLNGVIDLILGILIANRWPESSLWVIGLFVGIDLIFHGWSWMILALSVRSFREAPTP
jgi:uncharacterized membrane protein HdeD (DUF308 family)